MATHFARGIINGGHLDSSRLSAVNLMQAEQMPGHRRARFLASRSLLAELMFMLYGIHELPEIVVAENGRPAFSDTSLADFSIAYAGNMVGVAITTDGRCGLDMQLQHATRNFHHPQSHRDHHFPSNETIWINNQSDPHEAGAQLITLRQSVLKLCGRCNDDTRSLQLLPGSGRLRLAGEPEVEALCDAEEILIWAVAVTPAIEHITLWEYDTQTGWRSLSDELKQRKPADTRIMRFTSLPPEKALIAN